MHSAFLVHWVDDAVQDKEYQMDDLEWHIAGTASRDEDEAIERIRTAHPDAVFIWLSRAPGLGIRTALRIKREAWEEDLPIVFVDGDENARNRARHLFPVARFTTAYDLEKTANELERDLKKKAKASKAS